MKYYKVVCGTPFLGEENDFYIRVFNDEELRREVDECVYECGNEWYDEQTLEENDMDEEEYYAGCYVIKCEEITEEEYYEACPWDRKEEK